VGSNSESVIDREEKSSLFFMIDITDIYALKAKIYKLKHKINEEIVFSNDKLVVNKYLNKVLDYIDELR
jgi:hypothetical protein